MYLKMYCDIFFFNFQVKIESKILIKDTQTGQDFMLDNPKNCLAAYIMNCDQICLHPYRYYSEASPNRNSLLSSVRQDAIKYVSIYIKFLLLVFT